MHISGTNILRYGHQGPGVKRGGGGYLNQNRSGIIQQFHIKYESSKYIVCLDHNTIIMEHQRNSPFHDGV